MNILDKPVRIEINPDLARNIRTWAEDRADLVQCDKDTRLGAEPPDYSGSNDEASEIVWALSELVKVVYDRARNKRSRGHSWKTWKTTPIHVIRPDCNKCSGSGQIDCEACHGKGWIEDGSDTIDRADVEEEKGWIEDGSDTIDRADVEEEKGWIEDGSDTIDRADVEEEKP